MKNKVTYLSVLAMIGMFLFSTAFVDYESSYIPRFKPFGTATTLTDSTNYMNLLGKGLNIPNDSLKVGKYLFVGTSGGGIYLDTNRKGEIIFSGNTLAIYNNKENGSTEFWIGEKSSEYYWYKSEGGSGTQLMQLDTVSGLSLTALNFSTSGTGQVKLPSDTVSDYDSDDAVTLNRQSGIVTTKSLTTAADADYTITLTNSLISATTKVIAIVNTNAGAGAPIIRQCASGSGSATIIIRNLGAASLNSAISFHFIIFN